MEYIQILAIPVLILINSCLSLYLQRLYRDGFFKHVVVEGYDPDSMTKENIDKYKYIYLKIPLIVLGVTLLSFVLHYDYSIDDPKIYKFIYGFFLMLLVLIFAEHFYKVFMYKYALNNPDEIKGRITQSKRYACILSGWQNSTYLIVITPLAILCKSFYVYGALAAGFFITIRQLSWYLRSKKPQEKSPESSLPERKTGFTWKRAFFWVCVLYLITFFGYRGYLIYLEKSISKEEIDAAFESITSKYGIKIVYDISDDYISPVQNYPTWAGPPSYTKFKPIRHRILIRYPGILQKALDRYPNEVIKNYLNAIYFAGEIDFEGDKAGGTYDPFRRILYMADAGSIDKSWPVYVFHHEFNSLLRARHSFWLNPWTDHHPKDFKYLDEIHKDSKAVEQGYKDIADKECYDKGIVTNYGLTSFSNDFSEYSAMIFTYPEKFKKIMDQYPRVRGKFLVWLKFYQTIDPIFTEEYLFGNHGNGGN